MPLILSLETSTDVCSVALHDGSESLAEISIQLPQAHASQLAPLIHRVMNEARTSIQSIDAVAVSAGPGSYTGLRIGASTAKGMCYALDVPLIAIGTLELLASQGGAVNDERMLLCPMIDARRMEVYCLVADADLRVIQPPSAKVIDAQSFTELLDEQPVLFFGNGAAKCREVIRHHNAQFAGGLFPSAGSMGPLAATKFAGGLFEDLVQFRPLYLKEFIAKKPAAKS